MTLEELEPFIRKHLLASDRTKTSAKAIRRLLLQDKKATYELNWIGQNKVIVDKYITELSNQLDSDQDSDDDPQPSSPPRKPSSAKNHISHCPPPTQTRPRPRSDSNTSSLSSSYTAASSQSQAPLKDRRRSNSPTASVFSIASDLTTSSTSFLNMSKLPLSSFSPEQLADRLRLPPLNSREQRKADNLETVFSSDTFQQATSLANQTVPKGGGPGTKVVAVDESYPTWETGSPSKSDDEDFAERLDELGEMLQIAQKGGSRKAMKQLTAQHEAGGGAGTSSSPSPSSSSSKDHHRSSSAEVVQEEEVQEGSKKRAYSSDLPLASTKKQRKEKVRHSALPESSTFGREEREGEVDVEGGTGFRKPHNLSEALQDVVGASRLSRPECVKRIWAYIKAHSLQKPSDKRYIMCDEKLYALFKVPEMTTMNVILSKHLIDD